MTVGTHASAQGPPRPPAAVCVGESMVVLVADRPGPLEDVPSFRRDAGGAESNVACGLTALGIPAAWISRVGDDGFGRHLTGALAARGVDVSAVAVDPLRPTGLYVKEIGGDGSRPHDLGPGVTRMHYRRSGSAAAALGPELLADPSAARLLDAAPLIHLSGITAALSDSCLALLRELLTLRRPGRAVSFDLNWRPALWHGRDPGVLHGLMDAADLVLLGADEAESVLGTGDPRALRTLLPGPQTLVVKDAGHTATAVHRDGTTVTEPALPVEVVEATGAGDAFAAGYLAGVLRGLDEQRRLRLGHLSAALVLTVPGDHGAPIPPPVVAALLTADPAAWAATRVTARGIESPVLAAVDAPPNGSGGWAAE
ncbi:sugar kinase [Peterkaempfera bronchialis]|nr:sugar kinase [Peterkaempfera bronchialis]